MMSHTWGVCRFMCAITVLLLVTDAESAHNRGARDDDRTGKHEANLLRPSLSRSGLQLIRTG